MDFIILAYDMLGKQSDRRAAIKKTEEYREESFQQCVQYTNQAKKENKNTVICYNIDNSVRIRLSKLGLIVAPSDINDPHYILGVSVAWK